MIDFSSLSLTVIFLIAWSLIWKGFALWKAAKNNSKIWFIVLFLVNTIGLLEIIYIFIISNRKKNVVIGGTFDSLHRGHKEIIKKGFEIGQVVIGLTSDRMAKEMKNREVENFEERKSNLENYANNKLNQKIKIKKIEDRLGFAVNDDLDCIIVSPETEGNALLINKEREKINKKPLKIIKIDFVLAEDGKNISSTRIYNGEIDKEGRILQ